MRINQLREQIAQTGQPPQGGGGFNPYAAGSVSYGQGRPFPTSGRVMDKVGYGQRDAKAAARREALMRRARGGSQ